MSTANTSQENMSSVQVLFTISKSDTCISDGFNGRSGGTENEPSTVCAEIDSNSERTGGAPETILCVLWKSGKLGAAYFNIRTQQLYSLCQMLDPQPEFQVARNLFREVNIKHVITMGTPCDVFVKFIIDMLTTTDDDTTVDSDQMRQIPANLSLLPFSEYSSVACQYKIFNLNLPTFPADCSEFERGVYIHSLVNFEDKLSVHALGALIKYTEMYWAHLNTNENIPKLNFIHINQVSMGNHVYMSNITMMALQIFQRRSHDAAGRSTSREGESIFRLFSTYCKSILGFKCLRKILLSPVNEINELNKRLNFIEFATQITNMGFVQGLQASIRKITDVEEILVKIRHSKGTTNDWEILYKTIYEMLFLYEQSAPYRASVCLFSDLDSAITANLYALESCIRDSIDFSNKFPRCRPIVKFGIDEELDAKKLRRQGIGEHLTAAANFTLNQLPDILTECTIAYIPEMGHLLVTKKNERITEHNQLEHLGFQFMFEINDKFHFKNPVCKELDKHLGQIQEEIISHEIRIIQRVSDLILKYNKDIREPLNVIALMDCLISMGTVAKEKNFVRPTLNTENVIDIKQGRHILLEAQSETIVPNNFVSGGTNSKVKVMTGPNSCGKSIYLKQTAILVYLVHVGSYIPAESANVCMLHSIHANIKVNESAALRLSAFGIDLSHMSQILHNAKATSLVIIDEFGKGTTGQDAMALLAAALRKFILNPDICPHVLVSTHLTQIVKHLPASPLLSYHTFDYTKDGKNIVFLFRLIEGTSTSFTFDVAEAVGLDINIVNRAREIYKAMCDGSSLNLLHDNNQGQTAKYFANINIPTPDE